MAGTPLGLLLSLTEDSSSGSLSPTLFINTNIFFSPTVEGGSSGGSPIGLLLALTQASGGGGSQDLLPSLFTNTQTFYSATVTPGAVNLTPSLFTNTNTFYSEVVTSAYSLLPSLYTNTNTFYGPTVTLGTVTLSPNIFTNSQVFYSPVVTGAIAGTILQPSLLVNANVILPFIQVRDIYPNEPVEFKRYKHPYSSKQSTTFTYPFRRKNQAFGPSKTTFARTDR